MKKILLSALALVFVSAIWAQSTSTLKVLDLSGTDISGGTIHIWDDSTNTTFEADVHILNTASSGFMMGMAKRTVNYDYSGSYNYFCWTACYAPSVSVSPTPDTLYAGQPYTKFHGYFNPGNQSGTASITYTFYDQNNIGDSAWVTVVYHSDVAGIGASSVTGENKLAAAAPNPANSFSSINYSLKSNVKSGKIVLYNMLGELIREINLEEKQGTVKLSVSEFTAGVYFYSLVADNKVVTTKKLVVSH